jgi:ribonuclease HI
MNLDPSEGIILFTDGSAWTKDGSGGWAWIALDVFDGEEAGFGGASDTTNNRMEMQAWIEGLNDLHQAFGPCTVLVFSDSEYVGFGAMDRQRGRKANLDLWEAMDKVIDKHKYVEFRHVRGHAGDEYNELVDKLAGYARKNAASQ